MLFCKLLCVIVLMVVSEVIPAPQDADSYDYDIFESDSNNCDSYYEYQIFGTPCEDNDIDQRNIDCVNNSEDITSAVLQGDTRQAFSDCKEATSCADWEDDGFVCAPYWNCKNNTIITDGIGLLEIRSFHQSRDVECIKREGTLD